MTTAEVVAQAVEKYRQDGYAVESPADPAGLPPALRDRPALAAFVARKNGRTALVEVWARDRLLDVGWFPPSGWDLDTIVMPNPDSEAVYTGPEPTPETARRLLAELDGDLPLNARHARFLLAWSAVEAALRARVRRRGWTTRGQTPIGLIGDLTAEGEVSDEAAARLRGLRELRNSVAHGSPVEPIADADIDFLADLARELLAEPAPARAAG